MNNALVVIGVPQAWDLYRHADPRIRALAAELVERVQDHIGEEIARVAAMDYPERREHAREHVLTLAQRGDALMFSDDHAAVFAALLRILAVLALQPGGVIFAGHLWRAKEAG